MKKTSYVLTGSIVLLIGVIFWLAYNQAMRVENADLEVLLSNDTLARIQMVNGTVDDVEKVYGKAAYISTSGGSEVRHYLLVKKFPELAKVQGIVGYSVEFRDNHIKSWETIEQAPRAFDR